MKINQEVDAKFYTIPFKELIEKYPLLNSFLISVSPPRFNLGDPLTLSQINKCLYKEMLSLDIEVPTNFLIPSLGIRYAYADVINSRIENSNKCIEIGTGASAVISLILAKKYNRQVYSTEIDENSIISAMKNISSNSMEENITLLKSNGEIVEEIIPKGKYSALFCYPPIYDADQTKLLKKKGWKGTSSELIGGGKDGLDFTKKLIQEAIESKTIEIELVSLMLMNEEQVKTVIEFLEPRIKYEIISITAGTRKRFVLILKQ